MDWMDSSEQDNKNTSENNTNELNTIQNKKKVAYMFWYLEIFLDYLYKKKRNNDKKKWQNKKRKKINN